MFTTASISSSFRKNAYYSISLSLSMLAYLTNFALGCHESELEFNHYLAVNDADNKTTHYRVNECYEIHGGDPMKRDVSSSAPVSPMQPFITRMQNGECGFTYDSYTPTNHTELVQRWGSESTDWKADFWRDAPGIPHSENENCFIDALNKLLAEEKKVRLETIAIILGSLALLTIVVAISIYLRRRANKKQEAAPLQSDQESTKKYDGSSATSEVKPSSCSFLSSIWSRFKQQGGNLGSDQYIPLEERKLADESPRP